MKTPSSMWLARSGDAKARTLCDDQHALLGDDARFLASADAARKAAQDALARLSAGTR